MDRMRMEASGSKSVRECKCVTSALIKRRCTETMRDSGKKMIVKLAFAVTQTPLPITPINVKT